MNEWRSLYIKPLGCKTTEQERRAGYKYARKHLHEIENPGGGSWTLFTADLTKKNAMVYSIARPGTGAESSRFATLKDTAATFDRIASFHDRGTRCEEAEASYYDSHDWPELADKHREKARRYRELATKYRAAAESIRAAWTA